MSNRPARVPSVVQPNGAWDRSSLGGTDRVCQRGADILPAKLVLQNQISLSFYVAERDGLSIKSHAFEKHAIVDSCFALRHVGNVAGPRPVERALAERRVPVQQ